MELTTPFTIHPIFFLIYETAHVHKLNLIKLLLMELLHSMREVIKQHTWSSRATLEMHWCS